MKPFDDIFGELEGKGKECLLGGPRTTSTLILIIYNRTLCTAEPPAPARAGSTAAGAGTERASGVPGPAPSARHCQTPEPRGSPIPTAGQVPGAQGAARGPPGGLAGLSGLLGGRSAPAGSAAVTVCLCLCGCACAARGPARPGPAAERAAFPRAQPPRRRAPADNSKMEDAPSQPLINNVARCLPV